MSARVFDTTDDIYLQWMDEHPEGFVVNSYRKARPSYLILHKANCPSISTYRSDNDQNAFTGTKYIKICASSIQDLADWISRKVPRSNGFSKSCDRCNPDPKGRYADNWSEEELLAAVRVYIEMRLKSQDGIKYVKKGYYSKLASKYGRTEKALEYRMQNISYVYELQGRDWIKGLEPERNVGSSMAKKIESAIAKVESQSFGDKVQFNLKVNSLLTKGSEQIPKGNRSPQKRNSAVTQYKRSAEVVAWVIQNSGGLCECCDEKAPFLRSDETPFLEVHHVKHLSEGGPDTIKNAVAVCPNCHRELHFGKNRDRLVFQLKNKLSRLD